MIKIIDMKISRTILLERLITYLYFSFSILSLAVNKIVQKFNNIDDIILIISVKELLKSILISKIKIEVIEIINGNIKNINKSFILILFLEVFR